MTPVILLLLAVLIPVLALRKVLLITSALGDNRASFVNTTAKRLHIRKVDLSANIIGTVTAADSFKAELAESPAMQSELNDSRALIAHCTCSGTGGGLRDRDKLAFGRNDLVLDPDDALFLNTLDDNGAPSVSVNCNIFYED